MKGFCAECTQFLYGQNNQQASEGVGLMAREQWVVEWTDSVMLPGCKGNVCIPNAEANAALEAIKLGWFK